jgi:hypothetical protein
MSEKIEELESQLSAAAEEAHLWKSLMDHPAWEKYVAFLSEQAELRAKVCMLTPINNEYSAFAQEMYKGEYGGIKLALSTPETQFELADLKRKSLIIELENENEMETRISAVGTDRLDGDPFVG